MEDKNSALLASAQANHKSNHRTAASRIYRKILDKEPNNVIALNNLATIAIDNNQLEDAERLLIRAIRHLPEYPDAISNLAICTGLLNRWRDCLRWSKKAIELNRDAEEPRIWEAKAQLSLGKQEAAIKSLKESLRQSHLLEISPFARLYLEIQSKRGRRKEAIRLLIHIYAEASKVNKKSILGLLNEHALGAKRIRAWRHFITLASNLNNDDPNLLYWHAKQQIDHGEEEDGIQKLMQVVRYDASHSEAWLQLGILLKKRKNFLKAIACIKRSIKENNKSAKSWLELINCLVDSKDYREAVKQSARARRRWPTDSSILVCHCNALLAGGRSKLALSFLESFTKNYPTIIDANVLNIKGLALVDIGRYECATKALKGATRIAHDNAAIWNNCGMAYGMAERTRREIICYRRAIRYSPEDPGSHVNLAMTYLANQDFENGLTEYEWRLKSETGSLNALVSGRKLQKGEVPERLLIVTEQGLGDTFQFCRFLFDLRSYMPKTQLVLACPGKLVGILGNSLSCVDKVVDCNEINQSSGEHIFIPLMSIPYLCEMHPYESIAPSPYLRIPKEISTKISRKIRTHARSEGPLIGINWKGNPETERSNLKGRSMTLEEMKILADALPDAVFVSLQKGAGAEELDKCSFRHRFITIQDSISAEPCFIHTAAFCLACDYVLTTDTGLAHLSGAIGQRTYVFLSKKPEWRWGRTSARTPWYDNVRLFRQQISGHWHAPLVAAARKIKDIE